MTTWKTIVRVLFIITSLQLLTGYSLPPASKSTFAGNAASAKLQDLSKSLGTLAQAVSPALVYVSVSKIPRNSSPGYVDPWDLLFNNNRPQPRRPVKGVGSGFIIDLDRGLIATNNHVIEGADEIGLKLANGETYDANVIGRDPRTDVAVVEIKNKKFDRKGLAALTLGDSDSLSVGEFVVALGAPRDLEASLSFGIVSGVKRDIQFEPGSTSIGSYIQTDAAVNPGNSGGPLINMQGQAVGINSFIFSTGGGYDGISFAVPSNIVRKVAEDIISKGRVSRGYMGVLLQGVDQELAKDFGLPSSIQGGALITNVAQDSPAEKAGLKANDVVVAIDGRRIASDRVAGDYQLMNAIGLTSPNQKVELTIYRDGKERKVPVVVGTYPDEDKLAKTVNQYRNPVQPNNAKPADFGVALATLNSATKRQYSLTSPAGALVTSVVPNSPAARTGLQAGDLILGVTAQAKHTVVSTPADFENAVRGQSRILVRMERAGSFFYIDWDK